MIKAVFLFLTGSLQPVWKGPKPDGEACAQCGTAKTPKKAVYWLRQVDGNSQVLLVATPDKAKEAETLEDWLTWLSNLVSSPLLLKELSDDCLIWLHASDFPQWRERFPGIGSGVGVLAGAEVELGAKAQILMSSRVKFAGPPELDVGDLVDAIARPEAADEVRKGLDALRALANASSDAPKVPAPEHMLSMRLSFWRHELFRTVGALKWDLELGSESSLGRARDGAEAAAARIGALRTDIESDAKALPRNALDALSDVLEKLEHATRHLASGDVNDHKDRFSELLGSARDKFAQAASAAESVRALATPQQDGQP